MNLYTSYLITELKLKTWRIQEILLKIQNCVGLQLASPFQK